MKAIDFVLHWAGFFWQWFGIIIGGLFLFALVVAIIATIVSYCFRKINDIKLFYQFLKWKKSPEFVNELISDRDEFRAECQRLRIMATRYIDAYANMKQFAIDNGLDVTAYGVPDFGEPPSPPKPPQPRSVKEGNIG